MDDYFVLSERPLERLFRLGELYITAQAQAVTPLAIGRPPPRGRDEFRRSAETGEARCRKRRHSSDSTEHIKKTPYFSSVEGPQFHCMRMIYSRSKGYVVIASSKSEILIAHASSINTQVHRKGIYVLWLLQWTTVLDGQRYTPKLWEKWVHAAYFGRVYYWKEGLSIFSYTFEPSLKTVPKTSWYSENGKKRTAGGYSRRSKRYRRAVRGETLDLVADFVPRERYWWEGNGVKVPDAKLFMERQWSA